MNGCLNSAEESVFFDDCFNQSLFTFNADFNMSYIIYEEGDDEVACLPDAQETSSWYIPLDNKLLLDDLSSIPFNIFDVNNEFLRFGTNESDDFSGNCSNGAPIIYAYYELKKVN